MRKKNTIMSFASLAIVHRKIDTRFFDSINKLIDWKKIEQTLQQYYKRGESVDGRLPYDSLLLFKMLLLQTWYGLSDYELEERVNDSIKFNQFLGLALEDVVPDHSTISRFRSALTKAGAMDVLLESINQQLEAQQLLVKTGSIVDASITDTPRKPKGKPNYEITEQYTPTEEQKTATSKNSKIQTADIIEETTTDAVNNTLKTTTTIAKVSVKPGVDTEAAYVIKNNKIRFGYKKHYSVDDANGLVQSVITTAANVHDSQELIPVVKKAKLKTSSTVKADKAYKSKENIKALEAMELKSELMHKAYKNKPLTDLEHQANKLISKTRYKVERTFGSIKRWFKTNGLCRYIGLDKTHTQHVMEAIAYNLYRSPKIAIK